MNLENLSLTDIVNHIIFSLDERGMDVPTENEEWYNLFYHLRNETKEKPTCIREMFFSSNAHYHQSQELSEVLQGYSVIHGTITPQLRNLAVDKGFAKKRLDEMKNYDRELLEYLDHVAKMAEKFLANR